MTTHRIVFNFNWSAILPDRVLIGSVAPNCVVVLAFVRRVSTIVCSQIIIGMVLWPVLGMLLRRLLIPCLTCLSSNGLRLFASIIPAVWAIGKDLKFWISIRLYNELTILEKAGNLISFEELIWLIGCHASSHQIDVVFLEIFIRWQSQALVSVARYR